MWCNIDIEVFFTGWLNFSYMYIVYREDLSVTGLFALSVQFCTEQQTSGSAPSTYVIIMISFPNYLKPGWLEIYCKHFNRIISIIEFTIYFSTYMFQSSLFHLWNFPTPERTRNMTKNPQYRNVIISLNVWYTLIFTILQTHKDLVASDLIRQRVNTPTADVWFILQVSRLTHIKLILDSRDFNQESLYYVMSKSEFLIIRSKQIKVFILTLTLFLFEYLVSEVKSAPYLFFPLKSIVSINRWNSVSHRKLILHLHLIYLS